MASAKFKWKIIKKDEDAYLPLFRVNKLWLMMKNCSSMIIPDGHVII